MKLWVKIPLGLLSVSTAGIILINLYILASSQKYIFSVTDVPTSTAGLILGAAVYKNGQLSDMLRDRALTAIELYKIGKIQKILVSGDNTTKDYDEVSAVRKFLLTKNIPSEDIFLDYAGIDTYDSVYRAKAIFEADSIIITTQNFHLPRALFLANALGLKAYGISSDLETYRGIRYNYLREWPARIKAFGNILFQAKPKFLGEKIPITDTPQKI